MADDTITTQPTTKRKEIEQFVRDLDPLQVQEWSEHDVVEKYLKPIKMEHFAKLFTENHINGAVLLALEESHLREIGINIVGDRIIFMEYLKLLKKHKRYADRSKSLWNGTTPVLSLAYHHNCGEFCFQLCCPCCVATTEWRVTGQGIRWRKNRAPVNCCGDVETQFIDYRFLKDLELRKEPKCCCFCVGQELLIYADDKDAVSGNRQLGSAKASGIGEEPEPVSIMHPQATRAESIIRNAWADAKLVAD